MDTNENKYSDEWGDLQAPIDGATGCVGSFINLKQLHPHLQVILSIGGGGNSQNFPHVASSAATRDNFGRSARALVDASGFDGIDSMSAIPSNNEIDHI